MSRPSQETNKIIFASASFSHLPAEFQPFLKPAVHYAGSGCSLPQPLTSANKLASIYSLDTCSFHLLHPAQLEAVCFAINWSLW